MPQATMIGPSAFPLRFTEVVNFRGDFGEGQVSQGQYCPGVVNPKGIAFHPGLQKVIVSLSPNLVNPPRTPAQAQDLNIVSPDGTRSRFAASFHMHRDVESLIAVVPLAGVPVTMGGFTPGDVFVGRGPGGQITRLGADGTVHPNAATRTNVFADVGEGLWGGLTFDTVGDFGGELIVLTNSGGVLRVNNNGSSVRRIATLPPGGLEYEGIAVAPRSFGPYGGWIIVGVEGNRDDNQEAGKVLAINRAGEHQLLAKIPHTAEDIQFVPPDGGIYYQAELCFQRERENRLWKVSASQFLNRLGRMLVVNELGNELWEVAWDGTRYTQSLVGRVPGAWTSEGYDGQGTELEAGCFAALRPSLPNWTDWSAVPGATTDRAPAAAVDFPGNLHLLVKGIGDRRVYMNNMDAPTRVWTGWSEVPGGITTDHALAAARHNQVFYAFAIRDDGAILHKPLYKGSAGHLDSPWDEVPGAGRTDAAVAAAMANGRLVLAAKGIGDRRIYLNELAPGGQRQHWGGWNVVPNSLQTDTSPALAAFQDELYLFVKDLSGRIFAKVRSADGDWTDWAEVPGPGTSDLQVAAVAAPAWTPDSPTRRASDTALGQLYVFLKGMGDHAPYLNVASVTGTWSRWQAIPNGGTTDAALAVTAIKDQLYLFAKGGGDRLIYMRYTT